LDFHAVVAKSGAMFRRSVLIAAAMILTLAGISAGVYAQLESGNRGILPIDSSGLLEIGGIHVDVGAKDSETARYAGWRIAQREGFRKLYAASHNVPLSQAPNLPDSTLDQIVSSINVEREEIGPNRYIADLGIMFDRARAAEYLGVAGGQVQRSVPMLLIPVTVTGGTATSVELRNAYDGIDEVQLDRVVLDLPEPWQVVKPAERALRSGGIFVAYTPTIVQAAQLREVLDASAFAMAETIEVLHRSWHIEGQSVRPDHRMVAHTGFLTSARLLRAT